LPYEIDGRKPISSSGDWAAFERKVAKQPFCFLESTGNVALNARLASRPNAFQGSIKQFGDGKETKLRLIFDPKSILTFVVYLTKRDLSSDFNNLTVSPHVVQAVANTFGTPIAYSYPGTLLFYQSGSIVSDFKVYQRELTARVLGLSAPARSFLRKTVTQIVTFGRFLPVAGEPEDNPKLLLDYLKREVNLFGRPLAEADDDRISKRAKLEGLAMDDLFALRDLNDEDLIPIVQEVSKRELQFRDQISLWGFSAAYAAMMGSCRQIPAADLPVPPTRVPPERRP
jgi:hypothetical protein